jgi:hemoglobin-like flavoprotein
MCIWSIIITSIFYKFYISKKPTLKKRFTIGEEQQQQQPGKKRNRLG